MVGGSGGYGAMNKQTQKLLKVHEKVIKVAVDHPDFKKVCPRRYKVPKDYYDPAWFSCMMFGLSGQKLEGVGSPNYDFQKDISFKVNTMLQKYMYPHYFLDKDLIKLLGMTNVANDVDLTQIKFPFDACLFTVPIGLIKDVYSSDEQAKLLKDKDEHLMYAPLVKGAPSHLCQIGYARTFDVQTMSQELESKALGRESTDGRHYLPDFSEEWSKSLAIEDEKKQKEVQDTLMAGIERGFNQPCRVIPSFSVVMGYDTGDIGVCSYPIENGKGLSSILSTYKNNFTLGNTELSTDFQEVQEEISSMQMLTKLVVTLILYMGSKSSEYSSEPSKKIKFHHKGRQITNLYAPNFLGAKYRGYINKQNSKLIGSARQKPHWRSGTYRIYWTGKGRRIPISKWVMPYPVNMEKVA